MAAPLFNRYSKQILFTPIGEAGQKRICQARVLIIGCGALGSVLAEQLTRAGIGLLRIVDRDFVELSNLQRQVLFNEQDVFEHQPKAIAAADKLRLINSEVTIEPFVIDVAPHNIHELTQNIDIILDGTDNFETRYLINDISLEKNIPWLHAGCLGSSGQLMTIIPHKTACIRCLMPEPPTATDMPTCDTAGIISPIIQLVTSLQVAEVLKLCSQTSAPTTYNSRLIVVDAWEPELRVINLDSLKSKNTCPACTLGERQWLQGIRSAHSSILCGRNAIQISPPTPQAKVSPTEAKQRLQELAARLKSSGEVLLTPYLLKFTSPEDLTLTIFSDARAIIQGTEDLNLAKSIYTRYIGL